MEVIVRGHTDEVHESLTQVTLKEHVSAFQVVLSLPCFGGASPCPP